MFLNSNNLCQFEGRMVKDAELTYVPVKGGKENMAKAKFTIAVDKVMTQQQKEYAKNNGQPTSDFIPCEIVGPRAEFVQKYFTKGKPIKIVAAFRSYAYDDKNNPGKKIYGYSFDVVDAAFVTADYSNSNGASNGGYNNGGYGSTGGFDDYDNGMTPIDDGDMPF